MLESEAAAGDGVDDASVGGAVVGDHALDFDAVAAEEAQGAGEEAHSGGRLLVGEHLGVGEAAVVVDGDVDVLVADGVAPLAVLVGVDRVVVLRPAADTPAGGALDPAQLLDVDVHELAWP